MKRNRYDFDFEKVKTHLSTLSGTKEKIKYLIAQIADYRQSKDWVHVSDLHGMEFDKKCEVEIKLIKDTLALDGDSQIPTVTTVPIKPEILETPVVENTPIKWTGTAGQLVFLFELLRDNDFLSTSMDLQATIRKHFVNNEGKTFTVLKQSKQNYLDSKTGKPKNASILESFVNKAKEA